MYALKNILLLVICLALSASAAHIRKEDLYEPHQPFLEVDDYEPVTLRQVRSALGGSIAFGYKKDQLVGESFTTYNRDLYSNSDGRGKIKAFARGITDYDYNRNGFNDDIHVS